ncbi:MAG: type IV secretory system conjugative DNA transfer family protein [bacterium]
MSEFQEPSGPNPAATVFFVGSLVLLLPAYGYLVALHHLPPELLRVAPDIPTLPLALTSSSSLYLFRRIRRTALLWPLPPLLGALSIPLLPVRLPLVSPTLGFRVHAAYFEAGQAFELGPTFLQAVTAAAALAFVPAALLRSANRERVAPVVHGSARWASEHELRRIGLLQPRERGLHLGYADPEHRKPLTDSSDHHVLVLAPPGTGKTTGLVIPTLLSYPASTWVLDPKGELWETTASWRAHSFGHELLRFAPTEASTLRWNPLLEIPIEPGSDDIATAMVLAENLVVAPAHARDLHWNRAARSLWVALALHARYAPDLPSTMATVRTTLSSSPDHDQLFRELADYPHDPDHERGWTHPVTAQPSATHPEVTLLATKFLATPGRERGSIISTLQHFLDVWGDPQIAHATEASDFSLDALLSPPETTCYVSIPFHDLARLAPLVRLKLAALARRLTRRPPESPHRLELVLDEYAALGPLPIMEQLLAFLRGYNARSFLLVQDLPQLQRLYGNQESISGNCRVHLTMATQSVSTRRHVSTLAGATTARYRRTTRSYEGARLSARSRRSIAMVESSRPLITEGEVGTLPPYEAVLFKAGSPPTRSYLRPAWDDPELARRLASPPQQPSPAPSP